MDFSGFGATLVGCLPPRRRRSSEDLASNLSVAEYFGGRAEVRWRREIRQVLYCNFMSM